MKRTVLLSFGVAALGAASVVFGAPSRTFVASYGNDAAPCSLTQPCRGFQAAINAVASGGEVVALDSAGYGAMSIHKSVSVIVPPGIHAGLSPSTGIPIPGYPGQTTVVLIDIASADVVVLRGLVIQAQGSLTGGIDWVNTTLPNAGTVHVENTVVNGFLNEGLFAQMTGVDANLFVKDSTFRGNGTGIWIRVLAGDLHVSMDRVRLDGNVSNGYFGQGRSIGYFRDCEISSNGNGITLRADFVGTPEAWVHGCAIQNNAYGFYLDDATSSNAYAYVADSVLAENYAGQVFTGGPTCHVYSMGNNLSPHPFSETISPH